MRDFFKWGRIKIAILGLLVATLGAVVSYYSGNVYQVELSNFGAVCGLMLFMLGTILILIAMFVGE